MAIKIIFSIAVSLAVVALAFYLFRRIKNKYLELFPESEQEVYESMWDEVDDLYDLIGEIFRDFNEYIQRRDFTYAPLISSLAHCIIPDWDNYPEEKKYWDDPAFRDFKTRLENFRTDDLGLSEKDEKCLKTFIDSLKESDESASVIIEVVSKLIHGDELEEATRY